MRFVSRSRCRSFLAAVLPFVLLSLAKAQDIAPVGGLDPLALQSAPVEKVETSAGNVKVLSKDRWGIRAVGIS